jgi:hypothetical protein
VELCETPLRSVPVFQSQLRAVKTKGAFFFSKLLFANEILKVRKYVNVYVYTGKRIGLEFMTTKVSG